MKIVVMHGSYGCETGCCGHWLEVDDVDRRDTFDFDHPWAADWALTDEEKFKWARDFVAEHLGEEHVKDLDMANSYVVDD